MKESMGFDRAREGMTERERDRKKERERERTSGRAREKGMDKLRESKDFERKRDFILLITGKKTAQEACNSELSWRLKQASVRWRDLISM